MAEGKILRIVKRSPEKGYAEADSSFDIDGIDSAHKLAILASIAFNTTVDLKDIYTEGIANITHHDFKYAKEEFGQVIKLLAIAKAENGKFEVRVHPTLIPSDHLLAAVDDVYNAIYVVGDIVGPVMFYGQGAGQMAAASAIVSDIVYIARNIYSGVAGKVPSVYYETKHLSAKNIVNIEDIKSRYYLRFTVLDQPGVFATISGILGKYNISIASVYQTERKSGNKVPVIMMTYETLEKDIRIALAEIDNLSITKEKHC